MQLYDTVALGDARVTADGYLVADVRAARTGVQLYRGHEVGKPEMDVVRVYRPAEEVFKSDAMASFTSLPVTLDHPPEMVSPSNWKKYAVGFTAESVARDGGFLRIPLAVKDHAAIQAWRAGKREVSNGYTCDLAFEPGTTPEGEAYDAVQKNIRGNHLAIVTAGRAGSECRIGDDRAGHHREGPNMTSQKVTIDGITVEMSDTAAQVVSKLNDRLATLTADNSKLVADHKAVLDAKDRELGTKDAEIEKLKANQLDAAKLDQLVEARADVLARAKAIDSTVDTSGKSDADIRRAVVAAKLGDAKVKDRPDSYVEALFDGLSDTVVRPVDPVRDAIRAPSSVPTTDAAKAFHDNLAHLQNAWKGSDQKGAV